MISQIFISNARFYNPVSVNITWQDVYWWWPRFLNSSLRSNVAIVSLPPRLIVFDLSVTWEILVLFVHKMAVHWCFNFECLFRIYIPFWIVLCWMYGRSSNSLLNHQTIYLTSLKSITSPIDTEVSYRFLGKSPSSTYRPTVRMKECALPRL